jgi:hypothetical protein
MFLIVVNQTVPKYLIFLPSCSACLEQGEPVREEHFLICSPFLEQDGPVREEHFLICSPFLEQDEPVREEHPDVPNCCEPRSLHPGNTHHEKQSQPKGQYPNGLLFNDLRY